MPLELMLIRHGETEYDVEPRRIGGWSDDSLTTWGEHQVQKLCIRLRAWLEVEKIRPTALYASTLKRAEETARMVSEFVNIAPMQKSGLREMNKGKLTGLTIAEVKEKFGEFYQAKLPPYKPWPDGEHYVEFHGRVVACLEKIVEQHTDGLVIVVTHGGPINVFLREIAGISPCRFRKLRISCGDTSIHHFQRTPEGWRILKLNAVAHLA